ncbi:unnamed protein product [Ambrosiozyma monospora]|uniref:Unnamed protein product n=1 Tax=Ambrosiozyma monospora TaxID=43982 RepID=A0ACB5SVZ2_AMBMO|nr:unnamed protein product [Ambrosiozyma monospora]
MESEARHLEHIYEESLKRQTLSELILTCYNNLLMKSQEEISDLRKRLQEDNESDRKNRMVAKIVMSSYLKQILMYTLIEQYENEIFGKTEGKQTKSDLNTSMTGVEAQVGTSSGCGVAVGSSADGSTESETVLCSSSTSSDANFKALDEEKMWSLISVILNQDH